MIQGKTDEVNRWFNAALSILIVDTRNIVTDKDPSTFFRA
jgi:hypothetical protein